MGKPPETTSDSASVADPSPMPTPEENGQDPQSMHVHRIKPVHGWKEFLNEILIIVLGVLIALGLEQVVEAWHWREVVSEQRAALRDEIGNLHGAMQGRFELEPCFVPRLAEVREIIRRHDANEPLGISGPIGRPLYPPTQRPIWDLAVADQSIAHMELSEKRRFVEVYNWVSVYDAITNDERTALRALQSLNHADKLTTPDWSNVRNAYENAEESHGIMAASLPHWLGLVAALGTNAPDESVRHAPPVEIFCTSMLQKGHAP